MRGRFHRYELRTTDLDGARAFYADVLGAEFWDADVGLVSLPERARALGAPAHWLGHITPLEAALPLATAVSGLVSRGAQPLGPVQRASDGVEHSVLRDPFGALLALRPQVPPAAQETRVAWHQLHTREREQAFAWYAELFGWVASDELHRNQHEHLHQQERAPELSSQAFAWRGGPSVGGISNGARLPQIHPQWLFFFRVADLERATLQVRAQGCPIFDPSPTAQGDLIAGAEDPQGAAFGLYQYARR